MFLKLVKNSFFFKKGDFLTVLAELCTMNYMGTHVGDSLESLGRLRDDLFRVRPLQSASVLRSLSRARRFPVLWSGFRQPSMALDSLVDTPLPIPVLYQRWSCIITTPSSNVELLLCCGILSHKIMIHVVISLLLLLHVFRT